MNQPLVPYSNLSQSGKNYFHMFATWVLLLLWESAVCIDKMLLYDDVDDEVLRSFHEMSLANLIFYAMKEGACSEQSSRMTAMDAASKNAGELKSINN